MKDFNPGKYRSLIGHIGSIKTNIENERGDLLKHEEGLQQQLKRQGESAKVIQKQLSEQISVTAAGYSHLARDYEQSQESIEKLKIEVSRLKKEIVEKVARQDGVLKNERFEFKENLKVREARIGELELEKKHLEREVEIGKGEKKKEIEVREKEILMKEKTIGLVMEDVEKEKLKCVEEKKRIDVMEEKSSLEIKAAQDEAKKAKWEREEGRHEQNRAISEMNEWKRK